MPPVGNRRKERQQIADIHFLQHAGQNPESNKRDDRSNNPHHGRSTSEQRHPKTPHPQNTQAGDKSGVRSRRVVESGRLRDIQCPEDRGEKQPLANIRQYGALFDQQINQQERSGNQEAVTDHRDRIDPGQRRFDNNKRRPPDQRGIQQARVGPELKFARGTVGGAESRGVLFVTGGAIA